MEYNQRGSVNNDFRTCLHHLKNYGYTTNTNGEDTKELLNYNISLFNPRNRIINFPARNTNLKYLLGQLFWFLGGNPNADEIIPYAEKWDALRNSRGEVSSNYGTRLFGVLETMNVPDKEEGSENIKHINQWQSTINLLTQDKNTREAIQNIHMPFDRYDDNKDSPCVLSLHWFIRQNKLDLIVNSRDNNIISDFTNSVFQFTMLQEIMYLNLKEIYPDLELGRYFHNANSIYFSFNDTDMVEAVIADHRTLELSMFPMEGADADTIERLLNVGEVWCANDCPKDFNFNDLASFNELSTYWQNLIKMCFNEDENSLESVFNLDHKDTNSF